MNSCYIFLKNFIKTDLLVKMNNNILSNDNVNYKNYDKIVKYDIMNLLSKKFGWDPIPTKY